jgi:hypothetical protein
MSCQKRGLPPLKTRVGWNDCEICFIEFRALVVGRSSGGESSVWRWRDKEGKAGCIPLSPPMRRAKARSLHFSSLYSRIQEEVIGGS